MRVDPSKINNAGSLKNSRAKRKSQKQGCTGEPQDSVDFSGRRKTKITILYTNDMHGQVLMPEQGKECGKSALPLVSAAIKREREKSENSLLLDAGDISSGSMVSDHFKAIPMIEGLNHLGYDAMTLGNHEFDAGRAALKELVDHAGFPVLSANVVDKSPKGEALNIKPYIIKDVNGVKVGILGLTTEEAGTMIKRPEDRKVLEFLSAEATAEKNIKLMKKEGADIILVLSHLGVDEDKKLASKVAGIDVIIGGHSHTELARPAKVGNTIIAQTGSFCSKLGRLDMDVSFDKKGDAKISKAGNRLISTSSETLKPDPKVNKIIGKFAGKLNEFMGKVLGRAFLDISQRSYRVYKEESNLGNFVTDSIRRETKTDICIINNSGLRTNFKKGKITAGDVMALNPFKDNIVSLKVRGSVLKDIMEEMLQGPAQGFAVSGIRTEIDTSRPPGDRVVKLSTPWGSEFDEDKIYSVSTFEFMADGLMELPSFKKGENREIHRELPDLIMEAIDEYEDVFAYKDGRIINHEYGL